MGLFNIHNISGVHIKEGGIIVITSIYNGLRLLWRNIRSCFGSGGWENNQPWDNNDGWNNG